MKFKYKKFKIIPTPAFPERKYLLRPIIPLLITYKNKTIGYEALLDSGADFCIFHAEIGEFLDIPILEGRQEHFGGIVGQRAIAYIHEVDFTIGGCLQPSVPVGFSYNIAPHGYGILGHNRFFDFFRIIFDLKKEQIELRPKNR